MTTFYITCAGLLIFSGLFYLFPRKRPSIDAGQMSRSNLAWYQRRQGELTQEGNEALLDDTRLRLLEDEQQQGALGEEAQQVSTQSFPLWTVPVFVALLSVTLYYQLGAAPDVMIVRQLQSLDDTSSEADMFSLMTAIEQRSAQRPDNLHYVAMLGRFYMAQEDYTRAADLYGGLAEEAPGDSQALAYAAQAKYLAAGRKLTTGAQVLAEQALAIDPHQRTALGLLGMASFEQGQYRGAIEYWQRLLAMEEPGSDSANMIAGVIASAREKLGEANPQAANMLAEAETATESVDATQAVSAGVTVRVGFPEGVAVAAGDTVFILARNAESDSRMPVAVQRFQAGQLPVTVRLDDGSSMAGQKLSELESVVVVVQVSPDGRPGESNATWLGSAGPLVPSVDEQPLEIVLTPKS